MSYLRPNVRRRRVQGILSGLGSIFTDFAHNVKHAMSVDQKVSLKRSMGFPHELMHVTETARSPRKAGIKGLMGLGGLTSGPRSSRISLVALDGDPAIYTSATPCSSIPSGDPYRVPGNKCTGTDGHTVMEFDASGNVVAPSGPNLLSLGLYAVAGYFAYKALFK